MSLKELVDRFSEMKLEAWQIVRVIELISRYTVGEKIDLVDELREMGLSSSQIKAVLEVAGLEELKVAPPQVVATRISLTMRGAIFRLKRAFYLLIRRRDANSVRSAEYWKNFAAKLVEIGNKEGLSDKPARIVMEYVEELSDEGVILRPVKAKIEVYEKVREIPVEA